MTESSNGKADHDELIKEILEIISKHTKNNVIQSYHDIGIELSKLGLTSKKTRTNEWNRVMNR